MYKVVHPTSQNKLLKVSNRKTFDSFSFILKLKENRICIFIKNKKDIIKRLILIINFFIGIILEIF